MPSAIRLHRVLRATPARVYRAVLAPDALVTWAPPHGVTGTVHHLDARAGGSYTMSSAHFTTGQSHAFGGAYLEWVPRERMRDTDTFNDPQLPGAMQVTSTLTQVSCGAEVPITRAGGPARLPAEACYLGWQASLALLATLVEAEIPGEP
jgi:uncharacterized protein YndB with AHSA1/START domain